MNVELKKNKAILRSFMREQYPDGRLVMLLDHARSGKLEFASCCCFIGMLTDHTDWGHYMQLDKLRELAGAGIAENAFLRLGRGYGSVTEVADCRRLRLIPMILAEFRRRRKPVEQIENQQAVKDEVLAGGGE